MRNLILPVKILMIERWLRMFITLSIQKAFSLVFLLTVLGVSSLVAAQPNSGTPENSHYGRHFIILIDDSGTINTNQQRSISGEVSNRLFEGIKGNEGEPALEKFNLKKDWVTVLFFTILKNPCDNRKGMSVLPENIFTYEFSGKVDSKAVLEQKLSNAINKGCRFQGNWSPIALSSWLVLPYLNNKFNSLDSTVKSENFSQTILLQVTDGKFNTINPSQELIGYKGAEDGKGMEGIEQTDKQLAQVQRFFNLDTFPNWSNKPKNDGELFYLFGEYKIRILPESVIQYQKDSQLYPQATSSSELRYRLNDQLSGDIQILPPEKNDKPEFRPLWIQVSFQNSQGGDWKLGNQVLPREAVFKDLSTETRNIPLFETAVGQFKVSSSDPIPDPGKIKFKVGFKVTTGVYDHLCAETSELEINANQAILPTIPNPFLSDTQLTKNSIAAEWASTDEDQITTSEEAKNRILAARNFYWLLFFVVAIALGALGVFYLFRRWYHRPFEPYLELYPEANVVIDFNRHAMSRLLVGVLKVVNDAPVPWFGRLLKHTEQPTRQAELTLSYDSFHPSDLSVREGNPIGFVQGTNEANDAEGENQAEGEGLDLYIQEAVSDGKMIYIFAAAEMICDYAATPIHDEAAQFTLDISAQMEWGKSSSTERPGQVSLTIKPEEPRKPLVTFVPSPESFYFGKGSRIEVGKFIFESQATHRFAQSFEWGDYTIQTFQGNQQLGGEPIKLETLRVTVPPQEVVAVPVFLECDGILIPNPYPADCTYSFKLLGDFDHNSQPGPYSLTLYRDPTKAEIKLIQSHPAPKREIYWNQNGEIISRTLEKLPQKFFSWAGSTILMDPQTIRFTPRTAPSRDLLRFEIGNTGTSGHGTVSVDIKASLNCRHAISNSIQLNNNKPLNDLVNIYDGQDLKPKVLVKEGDNPQYCQIRIHPGRITKITGARIEASQLTLEIILEIFIENDQRLKTQRQVKFNIPLCLEQQPSQNWLAIDFGTSAISAAIGTGRPGDLMLIPLQDIKKTQTGYSLAEYDRNNAEQHNKFLLPSLVICDADIRPNTNNHYRPGFPDYNPDNPSLTPGEPDFVSLPAVSRHIEDNPDRIIYSLKSWLGKASHEVGLPTAIKVRENGNEVRKESLPLDKLIESGLAALAEGYLLVNKGFLADQIVICHPNTFTKHHQDLLHSIAFRAFSKLERFGIPLPERIKLISESDAVAYYYCFQQMKDLSRGGIENILVYDFGAGTLDLSLIEVHWYQGAPKQWKIRNRIGVPLAGNYIDEILARMIHRLLTDPNTRNLQSFTYHYPLVANSLDSEHKDIHRRSIIQLWKWIREAKHKWSDQCTQILATGTGWQSCPPFIVQVGYKSRLVMVSCDVSFTDDLTPIDGITSLYIENDSIYLSIPSLEISRDPNMNSFMSFITTEVIDELLNLVDFPPSNINTVIVSGRAAFYPGLQNQIWSHFPQAERPNLKVDNKMKEAVVTGAIVRQNLIRSFEDTSNNEELTPKLGILINHDQILIPERDWHKPIPLDNSPTFRLVQVNLKNPNPRTDNHLRKHFYIDLDLPYYSRADILGDGTNLLVRKEIKDGKLVIYFENEDGSSSIPIFTSTQYANVSTTPPWPIGNVILPPENK